jgi:hypothetical protein
VLLIHWMVSISTYMKLNLLISHRLVDDYVMADLFSFSYDLFQNFCSVCKSFLLMSLMNENEVFHFQKKKKKKR